jgi:hypothetical protein
MMMMKDGSDNNSSAGGNAGHGSRRDGDSGKGLCGLGFRGGSGVRGILGDPQVEEERGGGGAEGVVELERLVEKVLCVG